jgi:hypothetical protein
VRTSEAVEPGGLRGARVIRCSVYERSVIAPGEAAPYRYQHLDARTYAPDSLALALSEAPLVGDTLSLGSVTYEVIARHWSFTAWGSPAWPFTETHPPRGHECILIVVQAPSGPFVSEAPYPYSEDEEREAGE